MAVVRQSGQGGAVQFRWQGATVLQAWLAQVQAGLEAEAAEIEADLKGSLHKITGRNADSAFASVEVRGTKRTLRLGANMPYTIFEELRHPIIRQVADEHIPHITQKIAAARKGGG